MKVYHGTSFETALKIAEDGAILSPWEQKILWLSTRPDRVEALSRRDASESIEELALRLASGEFMESELEHRAKSVSFAEDLISAWACAVYFEKYNGGVVLGFQIDDSYEDEHNFIYIPRKQGLESLDEIIMLPVATRNHGAIKAAFSRYNVKYTHDYELK
jgi:hypothetical protein